MKAGVGRVCCLTVMELVRDNRTVIDRILPHHVRDIILLFAQQRVGLLSTFVALMLQCCKIMALHTLVQEQLLPGTYVREACYFTLFHCKDYKSFHLL